MRPFIDNARTSIVGIIQHVQEEIPHAVIEFVFVVYRDYDLGERLLSVSDKSGDTAYLTKWLNDVQTITNSDIPEAVEHGLKHVLMMEMQFDLVILAGDAPGHVAEDIPSRIRDRRTARQVAVEYKERDVPIYALVVGRDDETIADFEAIATASGGASGMLDGGNAVLQMVTMAILKKIGGKDAVTRFVGKHKQLTEGARIFSGKLLTSGR
jgi:hypothetical protein